MYRAQQYKFNVEESFDRIYTSNFKLNIYIFCMSSI